MIWQGIIAAALATVCGALSYAMFRQTREWNRIIGDTDWGQTIAGYFLSVWCGVACLALVAFAIGCFYMAGYNA